MNHMITLESLDFIFLSYIIPPIHLSCLSLSKFMKTTPPFNALINQIQSAKKVWCS